jgi:hypothetical protein
MRVVYDALTHKQLLVKHDSHRKSEATLSMKPMMCYVLTEAVNPDHAAL